MELITGISTIYNLSAFPVAQLVKNRPAMQETLVRFLGQEDPPGKGIAYPLQYPWASLVAQLVKNTPAMQETWVWSLGWEDPPEEGQGYPLQYLSLENSMDCIVLGVTKSWTPLSRLSFSLSILHKFSSLYDPNQSTWLPAKSRRLKIIVTYCFKTKSLPGSTKDIRGGVVAVIYHEGVLIQLCLLILKKRERKSSDVFRGRNC